MSADAYDMSVVCPERTCAAPIGERCRDLRSTGGRRPMIHVHSSRRRAANAAAADAADAGGQ